MGIAQPIAEDIDQRLGARIRDLRAGRGLTLDGLAEAAGVSRAMLSRIERGESSPTAQLLNKVCDGLGITLSVLFAEPAPLASPLARYADQPIWRDPATRYLRRSVSPSGTGSPVDIVEVEFPPGARVAFDRQRSNDGEQHIWVLDGTLQMQVGDEAFRLERGDCLMMHFDQPIVFHNPTRRTVRYAVVIHHGTAAR
jgi:transcriptional regulator with XRE-family HTH domain